MNPEYTQKMTRVDYVHNEVKKETERLISNGGKVVDRVNKEGKIIKAGEPKGLPRKTAKRIARRNVLKSLGYKFGSIGVSNVAAELSRSERRKLAKMNKVEFIPEYNDSDPKSYEDAYGEGYERFNNKYITIKAV